MVVHQTVSAVRCSRVLANSLRGIPPKGQYYKHNALKISASEPEATIRLNKGLAVSSNTISCRFRVAMAEPKGQCVPRQSLRTSGAGGAGEPHFLTNHKFRTFIFNENSPSLTKSKLAGRYNECLINHRAVEKTSTCLAGKYRSQER